jgi:hypothetical protein
MEEVALKKFGSLGIPKVLLAGWKSRADANIAQRPLTAL